jgi:hypothetical protein
MQIKYPSSRFTKAGRCFIQRIGQNLHANLALVSTPMNRDNAPSNAFSPKFTSNFKCQSTAKLFALIKCTTLVFGDLEVFKENFVERGKVLTGSKVEGVL